MADLAAKVGRLNAKTATHDTSVCPATLLRFVGQQRPITARLAPEIAENLALFLADWPHSEHESGVDVEPDICVERENGSYRLTQATTPDQSQNFEHDVDAANAMVGALIAAWITQDKRAVCLHASAARVGRGVVAFIGDSLSGKSSISLHLVAAGHRFFRDDRLAVVTADDSAQAVCLGLVPKLRLPLPPEAGQAFEAFVTARRYHGWEDLSYLRLRSSEAAAFGEQADLIGLVVLTRRASARSSLSAVRRPALVRAMIDHTFAPHLGGAALVRLLAALADKLPAYTLRFSSSRDAAHLIASQFSSASDRRR